MTEKKRLSKTMRIDLMPDSMDQSAAPKGPVSRLTRMNWSPSRKTPEYVARSRYQELLNSIYDATLITSVSGEIVDANNRAVDFLQYERADLLSKAIHQIVSGADESLIETVQENLKGERFTLIQAYCVRSDGSVFPAEIAVNRIHLDEMCLCFFIRDITLRMQAEERLRLEHLALQVAGNGIVIADLDLTVQYANPAFVDMLGYVSPDALMAVNLGAMFLEHPLADELVDKVLQEERPWMAEMGMKRSDGTDVFAQVSATCYRDPDGEPLGIVFSFADITQHKRVEDELHVREDALQRKVDEQASELARATSPPPNQP